MSVSHGSFFVKICFHVYMCGYVCRLQVPMKPEESVDPLNEGAGNQTRFLCQGSRYLTTEQSLQPFSWTPADLHCVTAHTPGSAAHRE